MKRLSLLVALALCISLPATAQLYKWVDSNGKVQYSDKPPPSNVKTEKLRAPPARPLSSPAADSEAKDGTSKETVKAEPKTLAEKEQAFRMRQAEAAKAQQKQTQEQTQARNRAENCRRAKAAVTNLEMGGRQTRIGPNSERIFLTDQQIAEETARARQEAGKACN